MSYENLNRNNCLRWWKSNLMCQLHEVVLTSSKQLKWQRLFTYYGSFTVLNGPFMGKLVSSHRGWLNGWCYLLRQYVTIANHYMWLLQGVVEAKDLLPITFQKPCKQPSVNISWYSRRNELPQFKMFWFLCWDGHIRHILIKIDSGLYALYQMAFMYNLNIILYWKLLTMLNIQSDNNVGVSYVGAATKSKLDQKRSKLWTWK